MEYSSSKRDEYARSRRSSTTSGIGSREHRSVFDLPLVHSTRTINETGHVVFSGVEVSGAQEKSYRKNPQLNISTNTKSTTGTSFSSISTTESNDLGKEGDEELRHALEQIESFGSENSRKKKRCGGFVMLGTLGFLFALGWASAFLFFRDSKAGSNNERPIQVDPPPPQQEQPTQTAEPTPPAITVFGEINVPIFPDASKETLVSLPQSDKNKLITISRVSDDNDDLVPVGRSYDGQSWETLHPLLLSISCIARCSVNIPAYAGKAAVHYIIQEYNPEPKSSAQEFARLLLQGTFGPTQTSLSEAMALGSAASWVQDQMSKPASLLRAHLRRRVNAYAKNDLHHHGTRLACEKGSRWSRLAFNRWRDVGKTIIEEPSGRGTTYLKIDGIVRTELAVAPSQQFSLPSTSYVICHRVVADEEGQPSMLMSSFVEAPTGERGMLVVAPNSDACMKMMFTASKYQSNIFIAWTLFTPKHHLTILSFFSFSN